MEVKNLDFITLDNGLRIAHDVMHDIESVSISVLIKTGSKFEQESQSGISHILEHMAFKGTAKRNAKQIAEEFDRIGGYFNAYTSREKTVYYAKVLKDDLNIAVEILADILQNSILSEEELNKERKVILQELSQIKDMPDDIIFDHFQEIAYPNQPIGRSIIGTEYVINNIKREDIVRYVEDHYGFNNVVISAAGNFDHNEYQNTIEDKFNSLPKHSEEITINSRYEGGDFRLNKDLEQVHFILGFEGVSYYHDDFYTQKVLAIIAGGGMSSRLFQQVRENRGLAYNINAFSSCYSDTSIFGIYSSSSDKSINELIEVAIAELLNMTNDITEDEVIRAKAQVKAALLMHQESSLARSEKLSSNIAIFNRYISISETLEKINSITHDAVKAFLNKLLTQNKKPTISSIGKINNLYQYDNIINRLKL